MGEKTIQEEALSGLNNDARNIAINLARQIIREIAAHQAAIKESEKIIADLKDKLSKIEVETYTI